jgi:hypothetical protein
MPACSREGTEFPDLAGICLLHVQNTLHWQLQDECKENGFGALDQGITVAAWMSRSRLCEAGRFEQGPRQLPRLRRSQVVGIRIRTRSARQGYPDRRRVLAAVGIGECFDLHPDRLVRPAPDRLDLAEADLPDETSVSRLARIPRLGSMAWRKLAPRRADRATATGRSAQAGRPLHWGNALYRARFRPRVPAAPEGRGGIISAGFFLRLPGLSRGPRRTWWRIAAAGWAIA